MWITLSSYPQDQQLLLLEFKNWLKKHEKDVNYVTRIKCKLCDRKNMQPIRTLVPLIQKRKGSKGVGPRKSKMRGI